MTMSKNCDEFSAIKCLELHEASCTICKKESRLFNDCLTLPVYFHCRPLQRMVVGMVIAGVAFLVAGFVQFSVQDADTSLSSGHAKVNTLL